MRERERERDDRLLFSPPTTTPLHFLSMAEPRGAPDHPRGQSPQGDPPPEEDLPEETAPEGDRELPGAPPCLGNEVGWWWGEKKEAGRLSLSLSLSHTVCVSLSLSAAMTVVYPCLCLHVFVCEAYSEAVCSKETRIGHSHRCGEGLGGRQKLMEVNFRLGFATMSV